MMTIENDIARAGRLSAATTSGRLGTPFDYLEKRLIQPRKTQHHPATRKVVQRGILQARRQQRLWRAEKRILEATHQGKNLARPRDQRTRLTLLIVGRYSTESNTRSFEHHWEGIMTTTTDGVTMDEDIPTVGLDPSDVQDVVPVSVAHPGEAKDINLELLVKILARLKPGRAGGADGVAAEFVVALSPDGKEALARAVRSVLEGTSPMPVGWSYAEVELLPKVIGASIATKFRPITVLPVMFKICVKAWHELARPFLQLRSKASHGFRPSFQAGEVQWILRSLLHKHDEFGCGLVICKIGIKKAYGTLTWSSIQRHAPLHDGHSPPTRQTVRRSLVGLLGPEGCREL